MKNIIDELLTRPPWTDIDLQISDNIYYRYKTIFEIELDSLIQVENEIIFSLITPSYADYHWFSRYL